tara:strand:+ start:36 stop:224 length:189 start_codon:yes stop_codon:yes gene_type:complete
MNICLTPSEKDHVQWDEYNLKETNNQASKCIKKMLRQGRISPESKWERKYLKACRKRGIAQC